MPGDRITVKEMNTRDSLEWNAKRETTYSLSTIEKLYSTDRRVEHANEMGFM